MQIAEWEPELCVAKLILTGCSESSFALAFLENIFEPEKIEITAPEMS
jgi:hypothetical protein